MPEHQAKDFGEWLRTRANARRDAAKSAAGTPSPSSSSLTIDRLLVYIVATPAMLALAGLVFFERYSTGRDMLQVGCGAAAAFAGMISLVLIVFAGIRDLNGNWKLSLTLIALAILLGFGLAAFELLQKADDREAQQQGKYVRDLERRK